MKNTKKTQERPWIAESDGPKPDPPGPRGRPKISKKQIPVHKSKTVVTSRKKFLK